MSPLPREHHRRHLQETARDRTQEEPRSTHDHQGEMLVCPHVNDVLCVLAIFLHV